MRLVRVELRRLLARRLFWFAALALVGLLALIAGQVARHSQPVNAATLAAAEAQSRQTTEAIKEDCRRMVPPEQQHESCDSITAPPPEAMISTFRFASDAEGLALGASIMLAMLGFVVGAGFVGAEWSAGTVAHLLTWEPRRLRVFGAKLGAAALGIGGTALVIMSAFLGSMYAVALTRGSTAGTTQEVVRSLLLTGGRGVLLVAAAATGGAAAAMLVRSTSGALGLVVGYFVAVELVLRGVFQGLTPWLVVPHALAWLQRQERLQVPGTCATCEPRLVTITMWGGATYLGVLLLVVGAASAIAFRRRDIT